MRDPLLGAALRAAVDAAFETEQVPLLQRLVDLPSHTYARDDVEIAAAALDEAAAAVGLVCTKVPDPSGRFADHRIYADASVGDGPSLALVGHIDTVFPRSLGFLAFRRDGDVARGPGVLDMKSGLTSVIFALRALRRGRAGARGAAARASSSSATRRSARRAARRCTARSRRASPARWCSSRAASATRSSPAARAADCSRSRCAASGARRQRSRERRQRDPCARAARRRASRPHRLRARRHRQRRADRGRHREEHGARAARSARSTRASRPSPTPSASAAFCTPFVREPFAGLADVPERLREVSVEISGGITRPPMEATAASQRLRGVYEPYAARMWPTSRRVPAAGRRVRRQPARGATAFPASTVSAPTGNIFTRTEEWCSLDEPAPSHRGARVLPCGERPVTSLRGGNAQALRRAGAAASRLATSSVRERGPR